MNKNIIIVVIIILVCIFLAFFCLRKTKDTHKTKSPNKPLRENFISENGDFKIYNYLNKPVQIHLLDIENGEMSGIKPKVLIDHLEARKTKNIKMEVASKHFTKGNGVIVYTHESDGELKMFSEYKFDVPEGTTIKSLHVGMVTSRWVGADQDSVYIPGANAVQGRPWIKIHNLTDETLSLNYNIDISPGGTLRYSGRDHFGVRLGTIFKDQNNVFPDFIFTIPATDVYYGVTSDIQQPLFGGWQADRIFVHDADEPQFLLENGWMGGPAEGNIPIGFLPTEGPPLESFQNRWGEGIIV